MNINEGIEIITMYIKERKGVDITIIPPRNHRELMMFNLATNIAQNYFINKNNGSN